MHAVLIDAFSGNAGTERLGKPPVVEDHNSHGVLNAMSHVFRPRFRADVSVFQRQLVWRDALSLHFFRNNGCVRRRTDERFRLEIHQRHDLSGRVASRQWNDGSADVLDAVMQTKSAGKHAVSERDLNQMVRLKPTGDEESGTQVRPRPEVFLRIRHKGRFARRAGRAVNSGDFRTMNGDVVQRISFAQVLLGCKGQTADVVQRFNIFNGNAGFLEFLLIHRHD